MIWIEKENRRLSLATYPIACKIIVYIDTWGQQVDTRHFANFQEGKKTVPFFNI